METNVLAEGIKNTLKNVTLWKRSGQLQVQ